MTKATGQGTAAGVQAPDPAAELRRLASERQRLRYLEGVLPLLGRRLREMRREVYGGIRVTQSWSFLPGRTGPGDATAALAARAADIALQDEYRQLEKRIRDMDRERSVLRRRQELLACGLRALPEEQRFLVETKIMDGRSWPETEDLYEKAYGLRLHRDTLRRRVGQAVNALTKEQTA